MVVITGIFMIALGIFHLIAIPIFGDKLFEFAISNEIRDEFILWFEMAGVFFVFIGIVDWFAYRAIKQKIQLGLNLALFSNISTTLLGAIGTIFLGIGPPILILIFGVVTLIPLIYKRNELNSQ